jgi:uncharacterized small protein (DUF1192 family)
MSDQKYMYLTARERVAMLRPRLQDAERQHYEATLNSKVHQDINPDTLANIETRIGWLQTELTQLESEVITENDASPTPSSSSKS